MKQFNFYDKVIEAEKMVIRQALKTHHFNRTQAAQSLGLKRTTLIQMMRRYNIMTPPVKGLQPKVYDYRHVTEDIPELQVNYHECLILLKETSLTLIPGTELYARVNKYLEEQNPHGKGN